MCSVICKTALEMYPRVKVRVQDQEDKCSSSSENDGGASVFFKFIESLYFEEGQKQSMSPLSNSRSINAYPQHITRRSTPATRGISKSSRQLGEVPESTRRNARASSVPRPRAVLSSPENDGIFASINDLDSNKPSTQTKKDVGEKVGAEAKVLSNRTKVSKPLNGGGAGAFKGKTPLKAKCTSTTFHSKRGCF